MNRGLHTKLMLIMLLLIISLMTVVCAFLIRGVVNFYQDQFYEQMQKAFSEPEFVSDLRLAAQADDGPEQIEKILAAYSGALGIDSGTRSYYVLDGETGQLLAGEEPDGGLEITPNIVTALTGKTGSSSSGGDAYMDVALPIAGGNGSYIVYIKDNKQTVTALNMDLFLIIMEALIIGLVISVLLSFLLSKTMVIPIQSLTKASERISQGDFSQKIEVRSRDEIGVLAETFNAMAGQLRATLEDIENERNKLSAVFLHMTDGVVAFGRDGALIQYNPAAEKFLDVSFESARPGFAQVFGGIISLDLALGLKGSDVLEADRNTGGRYLKIYLAPFSGEREQGGGILGVIHDVTEQRRSDEQRREFVANVSHELRTPITSIRSYAETLAESGGSLDEATRSRFLGVIMNESDRMTKIVQDLLVLSRFDSGQSEMTFSVFDLKKSLDSIYNALILEAEKHGMHMTLDIPQDLPDIEGDRSRIEQVVINVISNAVRYTPEGGSIAIKATRVSDRVRVSVSDTGIGIPKNDVPRLFDRFYRVDKARSRAQGGTGLGLAIAKEIISRHNGSIEVESEVGKGTTVTVVLPVRQNGGGK